MSGPRNTEPQANGALARAMRRRNPDWNDKTVHAERTNVIEGSVPGTETGKKPDILIASPRRQPVIVETEFAPAHTVDQDAKARLGKKLHTTGEDIEGVLSVVLPESLKTGDLETVESSRFRYATHYLDSNGESIRWPPEREWLEGGRSIPHEPKYAIPLRLWCNSTLGLILFWWHGTRQQKGRSRLTISRLPDLPVLDPRKLSDQQLDHCRAIFNDFKDREFLPANEAYRDETRKALDRGLLFGITSVLQLDQGLEEGLDLLRKQWCAEPSVHGGKRTRINA